MDVKQLIEKEKLDKDTKVYLWLWDIMSDVPCGKKTAYELVERYSDCICLGNMYMRHGIPNILILTKNDEQLMHRYNPELLREIKGDIINDI